MLSRAAVALALNTERMYNGEEDRKIVGLAVDEGGGTACRHHDVFCACCRGLINTRLPPELLVEIFSLLSVRAVCLQVSLTCHAWHALAHDQTLWQRLFINHFADELEDKPNRYHHLRLRRELTWRCEFQQCAQSSTRDIRVYLRQHGTPQRSEMTEITVNVRDSMKQLLKKASRAFNLAVPQKLVFSFVEIGTSSQLQPRATRSTLAPCDDCELTYKHWLELEAHEESVVRAHQHSPATGVEEINHVRRLFQHERRRQRLARLKYHQAMEERRHQRQIDAAADEDGRRRQTIAMVVVEDGDGPHQRVENNKLNPPLVTYYVNSVGPKEERVGHFLIDGCVGTCLISRQFLIDM
jgi:hypothetical protein